MIDDSVQDHGVRSDLADGRAAAGSGLTPTSVAASLLGTAIGLQATMSLFFLPFRGDPSISSSLSSGGKILFRPEQDTKIYILGTATTLLVTLFLGWHQRQRLRGVAPDRVEARATQAAAAFGILAALSWLAYLLILVLVVYCRSMVSRGAQNPLIWKLSGHVRSTQVLFFLPAALSMALALRGTWPSTAGRLADLIGRWSGAGMTGPPGAVRGKQSGYLWPLGIALGVVLLLFLPDPWTTAGASFFHEGVPFHHWDYYMMAAAIGYGHGHAIGLEVYTQYGVGYPMLVTWLSPLIRLCYGNLYFLASIYGCVYFLGLAGLFRLRLGSWPWAAIGVLVAAYLQSFSGFEEDVTLWMYPSSTILRYSTDVWFFGALWMHLKTGRLVWVALLGLSAGLAPLMGFDTGIYLVVILLFYLGVRVLSGPWGVLEAGLGSLAELRSAALSTTIALLVIVAGVAAATRRAPWAIDRKLLGSLFESLLAYSGGVSALPMSDSPGFGCQCLFLAVAGTYLAVLGTLSLRLIGPGASRGLVFRGCLSAYGLGTLLIFVQRSHPFNLFHGIVPFAILVVDGAHAAVHRLVSPGWRAVLTTVLGSGALALLLFDPSVWDYPGVIQTAFIGSPSPAAEFPSLGVRVAPASPDLVKFAEEFEEVTRRAAEYRRAGLRVAFLDEAETMFELASGIPPMDRYSPLLPILIFRRDIEQAKERFLARRFDLVVIRSEAGFHPYTQFTDVRAEFRRLVHREYSLLTKIGGYQVWGLPAGRRAADMVARRYPDSGRAPARRSVDLRIPPGHRHRQGGPAGFAAVPSEVGEQSTRVGAR